MNLYFTSDTVGMESGGGSVTRNEADALKELGECEVWDRKSLEGIKGTGDEPWKWDRAVMARLVLNPERRFELVHGYAGTFTESIQHLKRRGAKVSWTVAAHDLAESIKEHEWFYGSYPFHHMSDPVQFDRYKQGYLDADVLICPSTYSAETMRKYGRTGPIEVISHGCHLPAEIVPPPSRFTVGYIGAYGPDKGLVYLLQAWKKLAYQDAVLLLGGRDSTKPELQKWVRHHGGGNIWFVGWVNDVSDFYNSCSVYVQPSVTEGFGMEVLEAMAHGRPVVCSKGAGAYELLEVPGIEPRDVDGLANRIHEAYEIHTGAKKYYPIKDGKQMQDKDFPNGLIDLVALGNYNRSIAEQHTWDKIKVRYQNAWRGMLQ